MMEKLPTVAVVIPFYKNNLSRYEAIALEQCKKVLKAYPIIAVKPSSLTLPQSLNGFPFAAVYDFESEYFKDIQGYNRLMLSAQFYQQFLTFDYILIHQLDAFVFKDDLMLWAGRPFDYIGAPWLRKKGVSNVMKHAVLNLQYYFHTRYNLYKQGLPSKYQFENKVGNGGFSLRRVQKFYDLCIALKPQIETYGRRNEQEFNEDSFWGVEVNRKQEQLNIPGYKTAVGFSFEHAPEKALLLNHNQLPFGCHAWDKNLEFWRPIFGSLGYEV